MILPPRPAVNHLPGGSLKAEEHAPGIDPVNPVPVLHGQIHDVRVAGNSSVVHQDVYATERIQCLDDDAVYVFDVAYVGLDRDGFMAEFSDVNSGLFNQPAVYVSGHHARALVGESYRDGSAHSLCRARNQRDFVIERHWNPPFLLALADISRMASSPFVAATLSSVGIMTLPRL